MSHSLTLRELAERLSIDFTYLSKIENGKGLPPSEATIGRIAEVFNIDADELTLLAKKLPQGLEDKLLVQPPQKVARFYRKIQKRELSEADWDRILEAMED
jgi:transcriptional regulator with XRE-family HTH domain